jgi:hypothetical protein
LKKTWFAKSRRAPLGFQAIQAVLILVFAVFFTASHLPENASEFGPVAASAAAQPTHSAALAKKDSARAILSTERRHGTKMRWHDPLDALVPASFAARFQAFATAAPVCQAFGLTDSCSAVFQARAPPFPTV